MSVGFLLDNALAAQLKEITGSDVAFGMDGQILAATLPREMYGVLAARLRTSGISHLTLAGEDYLVLPRPLSAADALPAGVGPVALILRSRTELLRGLQAIHTGLAATAIVAVLLATILGFAVARTITRPLANITDVMREVAATGDLTRKIAIRQGNRWEDEDARLLATTFNTLTDSIVRFQREMSQKERLTSLGRLSTVIAHEIRNPLMIIKASLHTLRQGEPSEAAVREAVADIDDEVARLNRIVNEVLDFSRPIRFDLAPADVAALCRESAAAAQASPGAAVALDLDPALPTLVTDAERLRIALVNMLVNARHAVNGDNAPGPKDPAYADGRAGPFGPARPARDAESDRGRRSRHDHHHRSRGGRRAGRRAAHLRSVLHHQARRHRSRPADRQEHRGRPRRHDHGVEQHGPRGARHRDPHRPSRPLEIRIARRGSGLTHVAASRFHSSRRR